MQPTFTRSKFLIGLFSGVLLTIFAQHSLIVWAQKEPATQSENEIWLNTQKDAVASVKSKGLKQVAHLLDQQMVAPKVALNPNQKQLMPTDVSRNREFAVAMQLVKAAMSDDEGIVSRLCLRLQGKGTMPSTTGSRSSYLDDIPAARTLVEIDPQTASTLMRHSDKYDSKQLQYVVASILHQLDGMELAKARLDIAIRECSESERNISDVTASKLANLQAIRKLFDDKNAFKRKRLGS